MREILFFRTGSGKSPVEEFLDSLSAKDVQKVLWVLRLVKEQPSVKETEWMILNDILKSGKEKILLSL